MGSLDLPSVGFARVLCISRAQIIARDVPTRKVNESLILTVSGWCCISMTFEAVSGE